jgi:hypothetical protein
MPCSTTSEVYLNYTEPSAVLVQCSLHSHVIFILSSVLVLSSPVSQPWMLSDRVPTLCMCACASVRHSRYSILPVWSSVLIPVAARSKAWMYGRPLSGTAGSNPGGIVVCCQISLRRSGLSTRGVLPSVCIVGLIRCSNKPLHLQWVYIRCSNNPLHLQWVYRRIQTKRATEKERIVRVMKNSNNVFLFIFL